MNNVTGERVRVNPVGQRPKTYDLNISGVAETKQRNILAGDVLSGDAERHPEVQGARKSRIPRREVFLHEAAEEVRRVFPVRQLQRRSFQHADRRHPFDQQENEGEQERADPPGNQPQQNLPHFPRPADRQTQTAAEGPVGSRQPGEHRAAHSGAVHQNALEAAVEGSFFPEHPHEQVHHVERAGRGRPASRRA